MPSLVFLTADDDAEHCSGYTGSVGCQLSTAYRPPTVYCYCIDFIGDGLEDTVLARIRLTLFIAGIKESAGGALQ